MRFITLLLVLMVAALGRLCALSADDFLPPVSAETPEQKAALTKVTAPVEEKPAAGFGVPAAHADKAQDAINHVVGKRRTGCEMVVFPSGYGWVATGLGTYQVFENPTATRRSRRKAYVRAYMEAKTQLAQALGGLSNEGKTRIADAFQTSTTAKEDLSRFEGSASERIDQAAQMLLRGFVVYDVEDRQDENTVMVSIVTTPKTRGQYNRPSVNGLEAADVRSGLQTVLNEIQAGVIPPVGGKIITVPTTKEIAFVSFGSEVIQTHKSAAMQGKLMLMAEKAAVMRAQDALCGLIIGDDTRWKASLDEDTKEIIADFEDIIEDDKRTRVRFDETRSTFQSSVNMTEVLSSARSGKLPPGVSKRTFKSKDGGEIFAIAVYVPSVSAYATQTAEDMKNSKPLADTSKDPKATDTGAKDPKVDRPGADVGKGTTGVVTGDQDL